ncbi:MAG TPA: phosphodiester glycosidase family protein [Chthoniobacterales bacterium]|jgi:uncharacterized protein YigE (DUF2233 family)
MKLPCALVVLCCALATVGRAEWQVISSAKDSSPSELAEQWTTELRNPATQEQVTLQTVAFASNEATLEVVDQGNAPQAKLAETMLHINALAGVNGGYFDPTDAPVGLLVSGGRMISPLRKAKLLTGVLFTTRSKIDIVRQTGFAMNDRVRAAVQCGPLLVEHTTPVRGLNETRAARRTFAAVDGKGRVLLGVSSATSLVQLSQILSRTNAAGEFNVMRALNLDGGSSSAFWFAGKDRTISNPEGKTVRDFIAVVPASRSAP